MTSSNEYMNKCPQLLEKLNFIDSNYQFSEQFLNKSRHYYAICQHGREPSINSIYHLVNNLNMLNEAVLNNNPDIDKLINEGRQIIDERIKQWYEKNEISLNHFVRKQSHK